MAGVQKEGHKRCFRLMRQGEMSPCSELETIMIPHVSLDKTLTQDQMERHQHLLRYSPCTSTVSLLCATFNFLTVTFWLLFLFSKSFKRIEIGWVWVLFSSRNRKVSALLPLGNAGLSLSTGLCNDAVSLGEQPFTRALPELSGCLAQHGKWTLGDEQLSPT